MNELEKSSNSLRARTWYSACMAELGLSDAEMTENKGATSYADLHRRFVIPQLPRWAQDMVVAEGKRLRTFQNIRDKGFDPTASSVRVQARHAPKGWKGRTRAEAEGQAFVLLPVNLVEATQASCPRAAAWFKQGVWSVWSSANYRADLLQNYMKQTLGKLGLIRTRQVRTHFYSQAMIENAKPDISKPYVRRYEPWTRNPQPQHLDLLAGYVAEATLFGDRSSLSSRSEEVARFLRQAERKEVAYLPVSEIRAHVALWLSACDEVIDERFGPLASDRWINPILLSEYEDLVQSGVIALG
ncbi:hypothetical protein [Arenimonas metalli]|uniref:hypothetical protein n=1 Tax=Arenimonas metalli TaxID=948077 RepID=UPI0012EC9355|nr:hypothetical protein [Arenimonas metalli]